MNWGHVSEWATTVTIWAGLAGQSLFVGMYATRPWFKYRITRALMMKSVAFWLLFVLSAVRLYVKGPRDMSADDMWLIVFSLALDVVILWAIWYQAFALLLEIRTQGKRSSDSYVVPPNELR